MIRNMEIVRMRDVNADRISIEKMVLENILFACGSEIPERVLRNMTIEQVVDFETTALRAYFRWWVPGREVHKEVKKTLVVYDTWWDHFKATHQKFLLRYTPRGLRKWLRINCQIAEVTVHHYHLCPHIQDVNGGNIDLHWDFLEGRRSYSDDH